MKSKHDEGSRKHQRVIKKYPNRRLYDTDTSTYITLSEVRRSEEHTSELQSR